MDGKKIKILVLAVGILLLSGTASAVIGALVVKALIWILGPLIAEAFKMLAKTWICTTAFYALQFLEEIFKSIPMLLTTNPPVGEIFHGMWFFIKIIAPFYILTILFSVLYMTLTSNTVERAKAKSILTQLVVGLVLISISPAILQILFLVSENLAKVVMAMGAESGMEALKGAGSHLYGMFWKMTLIHRTGGVEVFALQIAMTLGLVVVLLLRQVMVILFGMLLPVAFFLYSFHPTKHIGKDLFTQTFLWTFTPVAWALALVIIGFGMASISPNVPEAYIYIGSFFFFLGSPMLIMGVSDWLSFVVLFFEVLQAAPLSIGAVVIDETMK